jgi:hypothetical protein
MTYKARRFPPPWESKTSKGAMMMRGDERRKNKLEARLLAIHQRMAWIANEEARSAWLKGAAAQGHFLDEKERLIDETDRILDKLIGKKPLK